MLRSTQPVAATATIRKSPGYDSDREGDSSQDIAELGDEDAEGD